MSVVGYRGVAVLLAAIMLVALIPAYGTAQAAPLKSARQVALAAQPVGTALRNARASRGLALSRRAFLDTMPAVTATVPAATATMAPVITSTAAATGTVAPTSTTTATAIAPSVTPITSATTATVTLLSTSVYTLQQGQEQQALTATLGTPIRLKLIVDVANAPSSGVSITATWGMRGIFTYQQGFVLQNGRTGIYYDVTLPAHGFATGPYIIDGSITYQGGVQQSSTTLHVVGQPPAPQQRVHYAHLRLIVPIGWFLDFERDSKGRRATGPSSLIMFSSTRHVAVSIISAALDTTPSTSILKAFPELVLQQEFIDVSNVKPLSIKGRIDGHDVFAVQGDAMVAGRTSTAIAIVTNKHRQFYAFTILNLLKRAAPSEIHAGLTSIFGAKLD